MDTYLPPLKFNGTQLPSSAYAVPASAVLEPYLLDIQQALPHMNILSGRLPRFTPTDQMPEIMVTSKLGLKPGDTVSIGFHALTMKVVGVWFPKSVTDPYWNGSGSVFTSFSPPCYGVSCPPVPYPVLFDQTTFFNTFGSTSGGPSAPIFTMSVHYISFTSPGRITVATTPQVINAIALYRSGLNGTIYSFSGVGSIGVQTQLDTLLTGIEQQFNVLAQPLYIIIAQVVGLALLFIVAMATLLIEAQAADIATLKSRGASATQLLLNYSLQGLIVAALAALAGPFLAAGLSVAIVRFFVPAASSSLVGQAISGTTLAELVSPQLVLRPALAGAALGLAALVIAAWLASRRDVLAFRRETGRPTSGPPFWQRTYLDLGLAVLCAAGYLELGEFGGLNVRQQLGQSSSGGGADPFQLVAPALLLLSGALVALRLFPLATRACAWLAGRMRGATAMLALAQVDRAAAQFARLALLLTLSVGLGLFALTFQASLRSNALAQASFLVGSDERVVLQSPVSGTPPTAPFQAQIAAMPGVLGISPVYRTVASNDIDATNVNLLAIDPATFAAVAYWRSNFASKPLGTLMKEMQTRAQGASAGDSQHPIWALVDPAFAANYKLAPGVVFTLSPQDSSSATLYFVVGAEVDHFPTLGDTSVNGQIVMNMTDYAKALAGPQGAGGNINYIGPNEYWLRTTGNSAQDASRAQKLANPNLWVQTVIDRKTMEQAAINDPLVSGMTGLLVAGAGIVALLAVLGSIIQAAVSTQQRLTQFAILRTLGGRKPQLVRILLGQQLVVFGFGLLAGTALGAILSTATLPFLQFSTSTLNTSAERLPPYVLVVNPVAIIVFYGVLLAAFALALLIGAGGALRVGLGAAMRIGED
jgi:ABC-type lipoprotein release transport system permease subunit